MNPLLAVGFPAVIPNRAETVDGGAAGIGRGAFGWREEDVEGGKETASPLPSGAGSVSGGEVDITRGERRERVIIFLL